MRPLNYDDCMRFVRYNLHMNLYPYQEEILKALCEGKEIRTARAIGRSYVADIFGKYVAYVYDKNDYNREPEKIFPYTVALSNGLLNQQIVDDCRSFCTAKQWRREFLCE